MLLSSEVAELAMSFAQEIRTRRELMAMLPAELREHDEFWQMIFDLMENVIHRSGCVIVREEVDAKAVPLLRHRQPEQ